MHLAHANALGDLRLGQALEKAKLHDATLAVGQRSEQVVELGAMLDLLEPGIVVAQARPSPLSSTSSPNAGWSSDARR